MLSYAKDAYYKIESFIPALAARRQKIWAENGANWERFSADQQAFCEAHCTPAARDMVERLKATPAFVDSGWSEFVMASNIGVILMLRGPDSNKAWGVDGPQFKIYPRFEDEKAHRKRGRYVRGDDRFVVSFEIDDDFKEWKVSEDVFYRRILELVSQR